MKHTRRWLASLLAVVMVLGAMPAALAAEEGVSEVKTFDELTAALADEKVEKVVIAADVEITADTETVKKIEIGAGAKLTIAEGKKLVSTATGMGCYGYADIAGQTFEDPMGMVTATYERMAQDGYSFLIADSGEGEARKTVREMYGSVADAVVAASAQEWDSIVLAGSAVLTKDVKSNNIFVYGEKASLTLEKGMTLTVESGKVAGDIVANNDQELPEELTCGGEVKKPAPETTVPEEKEEEGKTEPAAPKFTDVAATSPFAAAIDWAVGKEITLGKTETTFGPADPCTVSHILTFLWRANGKPGAEEGVADRDSAAKWAVEKEMIAEDADLTATCTRSMAVTFMWKAAESPKVETEKEFTDVAADAEYAGAVAWAVENGITTGTTETTFAPDNNCNRGQIVTFLYRQLAEKETTPAA